ncbi:MAG: hypothetical protein ACLP9L_35430 [Thermoguttaceae bacterium]
MGCRFSLVVVLASFAAMASMAGDTFAADPAPAAATAMPPASNEGLRQQTIEKYKRRLNELNERRAVIDGEWNQCKREQKELRDEIIKTCGLSPENVLPQLLALEKDRFALEIAVQVKAFHLKSIEKTVGTGAEDTKKRRIESDVVLQHLVKIVDLQEIALKEAQSLRPTKAISDADVRKAEGDLAEAQLRVDLRKEQLAESRAGAAAERSAQQAHDLLLDLNQDEMRLHIFDGKLTALKKVRDLLDRYNEITELRLPAVNRQSQELESRIIQWRIDAP